MKITVLKYYSVGTYHNVVAAANRVEEVQKRHPDRQYTVLTNMRGGAAKFVVAQVEEVRVELPTEADLSLPPLPERPPWNDNDATADYMHEVRKREQMVKAAQSSGMAVIKRKLNS